MPDFANAIVLLGNYLIFPGLAYGAQLALGALGITMIYAILRFSNFAHGDLMAFGTMVTILLTWGLQGTGIGLGPLPTALLALPFGIMSTVVLCLITDRMVYRFYRLNKSKPIIVVMVSVGVMFLMNGIVRIVIGPDNQRFADGERFLLRANEFRAATGLDEGLAIRSSQVLTLITTLVMVVFLFWFLYRTRVGKTMRAFSDNEDLAVLSGINPERVVALTWLIVAALATVAGVLYGLDKGFKPFTYFQLLLPMFAAAILGGIGNPVGAVLGGFVIAFSEVSVTYVWKKFFEYLLAGHWQPDGLMQLLSTEYKFAVSFVILVLVLLIRPTGIFRGQVI